MLLNAECLGLHQDEAGSGVVTDSLLELWDEIELWSQFSFRVVNVTAADMASVFDLKLANVTAPDIPSVFDIKSGETGERHSLAGASENGRMIPGEWLTMYKNLQSCPP